jgi:hypothetical protein
VRLQSLQLFQKLSNLSEAFGTTVTDGVGPDAIIKIRRHIRKSAMDPTINWTNALDLLHHAYDAADVERPTPSMVHAWSQYEDNITYAVQQLQRSTDNGLRDDSWRSGIALKSYD